MKIKRYVNALVKFATQSKYRFYVLASYGLYDGMPDKDFLERKYEALMNRTLNLDAPQTFNEKIQWLKLYDRNPLYTVLVDKYRVRDYISKTIGEEYLIPLLGVWDSEEEIDFSLLPNQFVLKCNHNSGLGLCICKNKNKLNVNQVMKALDKGLKQDYYLTGREWPYKNVPRKIICEKYLSDGNNETELKDYKLMCFNGTVKCSFVCSERFSEKGLHVTFFDREWNILPFERHYPASRVKIEKPNNYEKMIELAERLSKDIPFVRVDFYECGKKIYFGEMTFYPGGGFEEFTPEEWDFKLGEMLRLPN